MTYEYGGIKTYQTKVGSFTIKAAIVEHDSDQPTRVDHRFDVDSLVDSIAVTQGKLTVVLDLTPQARMWLVDLLSSNGEETRTEGKES